MRRGGAARPRGRCLASLPAVTTEESGGFGGQRGFARWHLACGHRRARAGTFSPKLGSLTALSPLVAEHNGVPAPIARFPAHPSLAPLKFVLYFREGCTVLIKLTLSFLLPARLQPAPAAWGCLCGAPTPVTGHGPATETQTSGLPVPLPDPGLSISDRRQTTPGVSRNASAKGRGGGCWYSPAPPRHWASPACCHPTAKQLKHPVKASAIRSARNYRAKYLSARKNDAKGENLENKK